MVNNIILLLIPKSISVTHFLRIQLQAMKCWTIIKSNNSFSKEYSKLVGRNGMSPAKGIFLVIFLKEGRVLHIVQIRMYY